MQGNVFIKKLHMSMQRSLIMTLFEVSPAEFVQCLLMEDRDVSLDVDDCLVGTFCLRIIAPDKQVLATTKLGFVVFVARFILFRITGESLH